MRVIRIAQEGLTGEGGCACALEHLTRCAWAGLRSFLEQRMKLTPVTCKVLQDGALAQMCVARPLSLSHTPHADSTHMLTLSPTQTFSRSVSLPLSLACSIARVLTLSLSESLTLTFTHSPTLFLPSSRPK